MICYLSRNYRGVSNAGNKAKTDIEQIMAEHGFRNVGRKQTRYENVVVAFLCTLLSVVKGVCCLCKGDVLVLQYPLKKYYTFVCNVAHWRGCKVVTLIHDLGSFRRKKLTIAQEIERLNHSDAIIVHSERMRKWLLEHGIKAKLQVLEIFDYLSDSQPVVDTECPKSPVRILFAGALSSFHNAFLYQLANSDSRSYDIILYGSGLENGLLTGTVDYKGFVSSDELIATAEGEYGLVWYGSSLEGGGGVLGEYLQYNAPHKMSLYIRCGLPLIVWEQAGLAPFVRENNIGICISSLVNLEDKLSEISVEDYRKMKENVLDIADKLSHGYYCFKALKWACADLGEDMES